VTTALDLLDLARFDGNTNDSGTATIDHCVNCELGKFCPPDIGGYREEGIVCVDGTYSAARGATECKPCPPGY